MNKMKKIILLFCTLACASFAQPLFAATVTSDPANAYFFDDRVEVPCDCEKCKKFPPPVRQRDYPEMLLGVNGHKERLTIDNLSGALELSDPAIASLEVGTNATGKTFSHASLPSSPLTHR